MKNYDLVYRGKINQPSKSQPLNNITGKHCIVVSKDNDPNSEYVTIWFTEGAVHSMVVKREWVSKVELSKVTKD